MNKTLFFEHFNTLMDAPDSIGQMRKLILQLAVQGMLVPQDPNDEPASELLKRIKVEKERLVKEKKIKKEKALPAITDNEIPYDLPKGWEWVRLGSISQINPRNYADDDLDVSFIPMTLIDDGFSNSHKSEEKKWSEIKSGFTHFQENDVVVAKITPCFQNRKSAIMKNLVNGYGAGTTELYVFRPFGKTILPEYLLLLFKSENFINGGVSTFTGTAGQQRVKKDFMHSVVLGVPSNEEQKRIVTKVDQLMKICDELEVKQNKASKNRIALNDTALNRLMSADDEKDFSTQWTFVRNNFDTLYTVPENVTKLRQTILQLAVQGKLVPQDPNDEPASELLKRVKVEKEKLIKEKKIKKEKSLPHISGDEMPYMLPKGWEWVRLGQLGEVCGGGTPSKKVSEYWNGSIPWVSPKDMKFDILIHSEMTISNKAINNSSVRMIVPGSILIVARSGILKHTLPVCINSMECTVNQDIKVLMPHLKSINTYIQVMLKGFENLILDTLVKDGMTVQSLLYSEFFTYPFPFPPLSEQKRIVAKVDQLMQICDDLESRLKQSQKDSEKLLQAVLHETVG
ncbi:restriction endonuclease subunit S [bacterium]|nr:restriction endonuclease subunit S [bacterium]